MLETYNLQPNNEWHSPSPLSRQSELMADTNHIEFGVGERPSSLEVQHLMEIDPDNTILLPGNELSYFGGELVEEPFVEVKIAMPVFGGEPGVKAVRAVSVSRISEDGRTLAYAINLEKAKSYITSKLNRAVA